MTTRFFKMLAGTIGLAVAVTAGGILTMTPRAPAPADPLTTGATRPVQLPAEPTAVVTDEAVIDRMKAALAAADSGDSASLAAIRAQFVANTVEADAIDWAIATNPRRARALTTTEIDTIIQRLAHWPGVDAMRASREVATLSSVFGGTQLALQLGDDEPVTVAGKLALANHHRRLGRTERARALIAPLWHTETLSPGEEQSIPVDFASILNQQDHQTRLFNMMVRERIRSAERFAALAGMEPLMDAWSAVIRNQSSAAAKIADLPASMLETPHGIYMRVEFARKQQLLDEAAELLLTLPDDVGAHINPDAWWNERRIISRSLREQGNVAAAYAIAAGQRGGSPSTQVDAAFHAGWYALRGLNEPDKAKPHFEQILTIANGDSSRARGHYWLARTLSAMRMDAEAQTAMRAAAQYTTTFYGQLAASALTIPVVVGATSHDQTDIDIAGRQAPVRAAMMLSDAGDESAAVRLITGLADTTQDPALITAMIEHFNARGLHFAALRLAKRAAWNDLPIGQATHPIGALPLSDTIKREDLALAYAIARQESEFRVNAVSPADARGLLQLLPSTARGVAQRLDLPFEAARLTTDAAYNTRLGAHYLAEQLDRFDGSYVLTFIAYNAGPGRAREWIERFGDPRALSRDMLIDWIEQIPFPETKNYVQKVMENLIVYKAKLGLKPDIEKDLLSGRST